MKKYLKFQIKARYWQDGGKQTVHRAAMKSCTVDMFEKDNNFELNYKNKVLYQTRLCPDTHKI